LELSFVAFRWAKSQNRMVSIGPLSIGGASDMSNGEKKGWNGIPAVAVPESWRN
jgi:hypothetical protein